MCVSATKDTKGSTDLLIACGSNWRGLVFHERKRRPRRAGRQGNAIKCESTKDEVQSNRQICTTLCGLRRIWLQNPGGWRVSTQTLCSGIVGRDWDRSENRLRSDKPGGDLFRNRGR